MKRVLMGIFILLIQSVHLSVLAQSSSAPSDAQQSHVEVLSQADSLDFIRSLNEKRKLIAEGFLANVKFKTINGEDCFGVRLQSNLRLVGHSARQGYGYSGKLSVQQKDGGFKAESFQWIGILYSEFPFSIEDQQFPAGSYALQAFSDSLRLVGNHEKEKYWDARRAKHVPLPMTKKLSVKASTPDSVVNGTQSAPFALAVKGGVIVMSFLANEWKIVPR